MKISITDESFSKEVPEIKCTAIKSGMIFCMKKNRGVTGTGMRLLALTNSYHAECGHYDVQVLWIHGNPASKDDCHQLFDVVRFYSKKLNTTPMDTVHVLGVVKMLKVEVGPITQYTAGE